VSTIEPSIFGRIVSGADVESWCWQTLRTWISTYLAEVERQSALAAGSLQRPRGFVTSPSLDKWPEDQLPALLVISIGLSEPPLKSGDGRFRARWDMGLACVVSARTQSESRALAMRYMAALRALFVQRPSLDGNAAGTVWTGESYESLDYDDVRSLMAGIASFTVEVADVVTANAGPLVADVPLTPDTDPWNDWPIAELVDVQVTQLDGN
jgi:hypothetical protein